MPPRQAIERLCNSKYRYALRQLSVQYVPKVGDCPGSSELRALVERGGGEWDQQEIQMELGGVEVSVEKGELYGLLTDGSDTIYCASSPNQPHRERIYCYTTRCICKMLESVAVRGRGVSLGDPFLEIWLTPLGYNVRQPGLSGHPLVAEP